ncbi:MAG TPA: sodium:calcium antiporter [Pirellulaceae bacterium]|jgi:cation:H+ antiporter|nr:sodium:calcium antiporter [Pirellulaceae bacterium]
MIDFSEFSLFVNFAIFAAGAVVVWVAGTKLSGYVDTFADRTNLGHAFAGALFLGAATSLPELATTLTASLSGATKLAGTNLLGGIAMQVAVLAAVDAIFLRGKALTAFSPRASLLMIGVASIGLLALTSAAVASGELFSFAGIGIWPIVLLVAYGATLWVVYRYERVARWEPKGEVTSPPQSARDLKQVREERFRDVSTARIAGYFAIASFAVLCGGFLVAKTGEAIAAQSGLGQNFVGATLVAIATSLPEVSTTISAVRFGSYSMAAANILGTNSLSIALFLPAELASSSGPVFDALDPSASFLASMGIVVTSLYLWGILERRDETILGMGYDSIAVLVVYFAGIGVYYTL